MFRNTMAVGPFEPSAFCVTGGTGVAKDLVCNAPILDRQRPADEGLGVAVPAALRESCKIECRVAISCNAYRSMVIGQLIVSTSKE